MRTHLRAVLLVLGMLPVLGTDCGMETFPVALRNDRTEAIDARIEYRDGNVLEVSIDPERAPECRSR
jgi:hypothetical protein